MDLWPGVAARIGVAEQPLFRARQKTAILPMRSAARRFSFTVPQLVAAGLALMLLSGGTVWLARMGGQRTDFPPVSAQRDDRQLTDVRAVDAYYDQAIAELQRTMDAGRGRLDPATLRVLETNLQAIDRAIEQCRAALAADPGERVPQNPSRERPAPQADAAPARDSARRGAVVAEGGSADKP